MRYYELRTSEIPEALRFRNSLFSFVDTRRWRVMRCTGVVARTEPEDAVAGALKPDIIAGFIPLQFRDQLLRPGVSAPVVYENAVGVDERVRSKGIGTAMIDTAAGFIADRADALFVVRGGESTPGYRFYRKTGHSDLSYETSWSVASDELSRQIAASRSIMVTDIDCRSWLAAEGRLNRLYQEEFRSFGGGRVRGRGYWREILDGHVFGDRNWRFLTATSRDGAMCGYAVIVPGTWTHLDERCVYELVAESDVVASQLLRAACNGYHGTLRIPSVSLENPIRRLLVELGCTDGRSEPQIMARIVAPVRLFSRLAASTPGIGPQLHGLRIECSTPHRSIDLIGDRSSPRAWSLEMKEHTLASMLCCRLDVVAAERNGAIRMPRPNASLLAVIAEICRPAPWVQWYTDYV